MCRLTIVASVLTAGLLTAQLHAEEGLKFRFKAKTGDKRYYEISSKMEMSQKIAGMDLDTKRPQSRLSDGKPRNQPKKA